MRPVTSTVPKELLPVGTRPMLQWCLTEALEGGFREIAVVVSETKALLQVWIEEGRWREGLLDRVRDAAAGADVTTVRQARPAGVVNAVLSAEEWTAAGRPFAVYLPDNVRIEGPPPLSAAHVEEAADAGGLAACHRVGPETRAYYANVGRVELDPLAPAGSHPAVLRLEPRGPGVFRAAPEGSWRLLPRWVVTPRWLELAREVAAAAERDEEADDVEVHRRLIVEDALRAVPWSGTIVDAGGPAGYLYAQHLLHEAGERARRAEEEGDPWRS